MAKLRKMLGDINDETIIELMKVIETQNAEVLALWALDYVDENVMPIYEKSTDDLSLRNLVICTRQYIANNQSLKEIKQMIKETKGLVKEVENDDVALACVRAVLTACAVKHTPTNALGYTFYCAAAIVYDKVGLFETKQVYDTLAKIEFSNMLDALQKVAITNEKNPVKVNWNC